MRALKKESSFLSRLATDIKTSYLSLNFYKKADSYYPRLATKVAKIYVGGHHAV